MNKENNVRYNPPSKYDIAHYGMILKVMGEDDSFEYFVQCSSNLDTPDWKPISYLLEKTFLPFVDEFFVSLCLSLSSCNPEDRAEHLKKLANTLYKQ